MRRKILIVAVAAAIGALALTGLVRPWRDAPGDVVPGDLELPWMWQATVGMDAPGRASILAGGDTLGFRGTDLFDAEGKIAVVGRGGDYRMLLHGGWDTVAAGEDVLLSPDGRRVVRPPVDQDSLEVIDLESGRSTFYPPPDFAAPPSSTQAPGWSGPVAWAPDGKSVLAEVYAGDDTHLALLDLETRAVQPIGERILHWQRRTASRAAFAPDGGHLAISAGNQVRLVDRTGKMVWAADLGDRAYLAGAGAFTPDGSKIAIAELAGCLDDCDAEALAARSWTVSYLDAATGKPAPGPSLAAVTGSAIRALGWSQGRDLVILRYEPEDDAYREARADAALTEWNDTGWQETAHITLLALPPSGTARTLLDPPDGVLTMDVSQDLLQAGSFGGPTPAADPFPARPIIWWTLAPLACLAVILTPAFFAVRRRLSSRYA
ncbi:hypothetical protein AMIS_38700 [Actinoplanes missouriensis 431]|uniref:Uncharacterized protein n=1 Tax=Actinoplanes missouriensis (strain ATCC 14538 / DSM 43046 / CBS 188.64 / JCM 3121 / NBRC 102363 / NCIMB 12654 / NRRL B-3342 / UNCC 431) TaxID=512565 RepID=I0H7V3_ACTM4|nr:hypothetical protein [Actinoplanes missouriensis]BAL89090.1 hypothetical protein AMIS_38700 [Actinoplanes missouriensis 431]